MNHSRCRIAVVDDEKELTQNLQTHLQNEGFKVDGFFSLQEAEKINPQNFEIILLDWMLPDGAGIDQLKKWRRQGFSTPVIMMTARADIIDKVLGLESGANDYITKPFDPRELIARIRVQIRNDLHSVININGIEIHLDERSVKYEGQSLQLTKTEFELLKFLASNPDKVFSRDEILQSVWGYEQYPTTRTVDVHVMQLRQTFKPEFFETVHRIGYRMRRFR